MILKPDRRKLISGLIGLVAAPAIVRAASLMPVRAIQSAPLGRELLFGMVGTDHISVACGREVSAAYSIDFGPFRPCQGVVTELEQPGVYAITLTADELRGKFTALHFTAADADPTDMITDGRRAASITTASIR